MIKIIDNFFEDTDMLDNIYRYFYYAGQWQFDFFTHKYVWKKKQNTDIETDIATIIRTLCTLEPKFAGKGYEVWINMHDKENFFLPHHVDCEEAARGEIKPSKMTATIYLGSEENMEGGDLAIDTEPYSPSTEFSEDIYDLEKEVNKNQYNNWLKVPYKYNRLVLFNEAYPHAILPIKAMKKGNARITLIISSWDREIEVIR